MKSTSSRLTLLLALLVAATPAAAKVSLKACKTTCVSRVAGDCAALAKKKQKKCRARIIWRQCKRGRLECVTTSTTLPPGSGSACVTTFLVGDQQPGGTDQVVATGDLNGDGRRDLVVVANPAAMVRLGNGDGTFGPLAGWDVGGDGRSIAIADLNGDGRTDLAVANFMADPPPAGPSTVVNVSVLLGNGDGTFATPAAYFVGNRDFHDVAAGDLNGDGRPDLVVATQPSVVVLLNNGSGTFADRVEYPVVTIGRALALADVNGDGALDVAATSAGGPSSPGSVAVLLGDGHGALGAAVPYTVGRFPYSIVAGDVNGDGHVDLATANNNSSDMSVLLGSGDGTFGANVDYDAGGLPTSLAGGDFNADGRLDFVISAGPGGSVGLFTGGGDGTFAKVEAIATFGSAALATGDFNGDGLADVLTATPLGHRVLLSRCK